MTIASLYWARALAAWSRAQAFLRRLRREKPQFYRFALEVPVGVALSALFYADVISDIIVASSLRDTGNPGWTFLAALFIALPYLASYASVAAYLLRAYGARAAFFAFLALGLPSGVLLLDVAMFAAPLTLLRELPDSPAATQLKLFLPSYRSTRVLFEAALETLPQSALQLHIYVALTHYGASTAFESKMAPLVAISFAFSVVNLIKTLVVLVVDARAAGVPLRAHLAQQLALGQGLPLHALKAGALDVWRCALPLDPVTLRELAAAMRPNVSLRHLDLSYALVALPERAAGAVTVCEALRRNDTLTSLDLSHNGLGGGALVAVRALAELLQRPGCALLSLGLAGNGLGARSCAVLADGLSGNARLYSLDLSKNSLCGVDACGVGTETSDGVRALGAALADHPSLRVLSLAHNRLGAATGAALAGALQPCTLASLDVSSNPDLGAAARDALRAALAQRASSGEEKPPAFGAAGTPRALRQARDVIRASEAAEAEQQGWTPRCRDHASSTAAAAKPDAARAMDAIASRLSPTARSPGRRAYAPISPVSRLDLSEPLERV